MKKFWILVGIILILAAIPRAVELISHNYLFGFDQGNFMLAVKHIVVDHKLTLIGVEVGNIGGFFQGPGWYYLLAIPFALTNGDPYGAMMLMFLISMTTVVLSIVLTRKFFTNTIALCLGFFIATSIPLISQARFIWPPFPISLLTVCYLYFLFNVFKGKSMHLIFAVLMISLMFHFESAVGATLLLELILFSPILFVKKLISLKAFLYSIIAFIVPFLPLIFFDLRHNFIATKGLIAYFSHSSPHSHETYLAMIQNHVAVFESTYLSIVPFSDLFAVIFLFFILICSVFYLRDSKVHTEQKLVLWYLLISPILLFIVFLAMRSDIWPWWLFELLIVYLYVFGIIVGWLLEQKKLMLVGIIVLLLFFVNYMQQTTKFYKGDLYDYGGTAKLKGKIDAIDYIYKDSKGKPFDLLVFSPPVYTYPYDYLLWWYGERKYHYIPGNEKKGTFYLLIEQDPAQPWSYKGWLETIIKTGTIEKTVTLPSGFIIQKRIAQ